MLRRHSHSHLLYSGISTTAGGGVLGRLRSSTLSPSSSTPRRSRGVLELGRGVLELKLHEVPTTDSSQVPRVQVQVPKSNEAKPSWTWGLGLGRGGLELKLHEEESKYTEA